eukprot:UN3539
MQTLLALLRVIIPAYAAGQLVRSILQGPDLVLYLSTIHHICLPCRQGCYALLLGMRDNATNVSMADVVGLWPCQATTSTRTTTRGQLAR